MACNTKKIQQYLANEIKRLDELIEQGIEFPASGENLKLSRDMLKESMIAVHQGTYDGKSMQEKARVNASLVYVVTRQNLKETFKAGISSNPKAGMVLSSELNLLDVIHDGDNIKLKVESARKGTPMEFTFQKGRNVSMPAKSGVKLYIPGFADVMAKVQRTVNESVQGLNKIDNAIAARESLDAARAVINGDKLLGSLEGIKFDYMKGVRRPDYVHGDPDHMKQLVRDLHVLGNSKASKEHLEYLEGLLGNMHPSFFKEMSVFINENANTTAGWVNVDKKHVLFNVSKKTKDMHNHQSEAEVAVHEIIHTMTTWALSQTGLVSGKFKRQLDYFIKRAKDRTKWQDFLGKEESAASTSEKKVALQTYEYIFNSEYADDEFIAYVLTNPVVMKHMKTIKVSRVDEEPTTIFDKMTEFFINLMDMVLGNFNLGAKNSTVYNEIHALAFKLAEVNNKSEYEIDNLNVLGKANEALNTIDNKIHDAVQEFSDKHFDKTGRLERLPPDASELQRVVHTLKFFAKGMYNEHFKGAAGLFMSGIRLGPQSSLREFTRSLFTPSEASREIEMAGLQVNKLEMLRNSYVNQSKKSILNGFDRKLTIEEESALTRVLLETNLTSLMYSDDEASTKQVYSISDVAKLLGDSSELKAKLKVAKDNLTKIAGDRSNWVVAQAEGLGRFMATHQGHIAQNSNAYSIAKGYLTNERHTADPDMMASIDEVATLTALTQTKAEKKQVVADLIGSQVEGVKNVSDMYEGFKKQSESTLFQGDKGHMITGYTKEIFDDTLETTIRPMSEKEELLREGYKFIGKVPVRNGEQRSQDYGYFVSESFARAERLKGAVSLGGLHARGTGLKEMKFKEHPELGMSFFNRDKAVIDKNAVALRLKIEKGEVEWDSVEYGMMPVLDATGNVVDYRSMMNKEQKENVLKQDLTISEVLSKSMGGIVYKAMIETHNADVLKLVKNDMSNNWSGGTLGKKGITEYSLIGPDVADQKMKELYYMLPRTFQEFIRHRADKTMAIPTEDLHMYFGYKHLQASNLPGIDRLPKVVSRIINMFESFWGDLIKIAKGNILLKMPLILIGNLASNIIYALNTGMTPLEVFKMYRESFRDVRAFMSKNREAIALDLEVRSLEAKFHSTEVGLRGSIADVIKEKRDRVERLKKEMGKSQVKELFDLGMYQSVVEDIETSQLNNSNKLTEGMDKLLNKTPVFIKTPLQWLYLSKETKWYQVNQEVLQMSDLIARDVMNRKQKQIEKEQAVGKRDLPLEFRQHMGKGFPKKKKLEGETLKTFMEMAEKSRHTQLVDSFVNYNKPNGRFEEYLNRMGVLMFTKYFKRIQRVIMQSGSRHPLKTILTLLAASTFMDLDNIQDQAFLTKGFRDGEFSFTSLVPVYSPLDQVMNVITPGLIKEDLRMGLI